MYATIDRHFPIVHILFSNHKKFPLNKAHTKISTNIKKSCLLIISSKPNIIYARTICCFARDVVRNLKMRCRKNPDSWNSSFFFFFLFNKRLKVNYQPLHTHTLKSTLSGKSKQMIIQKRMQNCRRNFRMGIF